MRNWKLASGDPLSLTLATDARLVHPDYTNDHIWEMHLGGGDPPALAVETTYGLRARLMRIFPRIVEGSQGITDPSGFSSPPEVIQFYPNFLCLSFSPFVGIDVIAEYWVPASQVITGRIRISNQSIVPRQIRLEWTTLLNAQGDGRGMEPCQMGVSTVLCGSTDDLAPVLFMTGGPEAAGGPYPALALDLDLPPGNHRQFSWAAASLSEPTASFELARHTTARSWDAELARIELQNEADTIDIQTGDPNWDAVFAFSQKVAFNLLIGDGDGLPRQSFVLSRQPDQGFSPRPDGSDYTHLWNGQTALDTYYLSWLLLPARASALHDFLCNFLATLTEDGWMDWKPGIGGQRGRLMVQPVLATLAWKIYQVQQDPAFLQQIFPDLLSAVRNWMQVHDLDGDGVPEWDHALQLGLEDNPTFDRWRMDGQGLDVTTVEDPALCAFLVHECRCLIRMADQLKLDEPIPLLTSWINQLSQAVESVWDAKIASYHYRDRDTHGSYKAELLANTRGPVGLKRPRKLRTPRRLVFRIQTSGETTRNPTLHIHGEGPSGPVEEHISTRSFIWLHGNAVITSQKIFSLVDRIEIDGLDPNDPVLIRSADYTQENISLLLPLWSQIPHAKRAQKIVEETLFHPGRYGHPYGLPANPFSSAEDLPAPFAPGVSMLWNSLIGEGLLEYGFRDRAAELFTRMMGALVLILQRENAFRSTYHADSAVGAGETNVLQGLAPVGLFLEILGVRLLSPWKVLIQENNPFPWPVTVKYRGMRILRQENQAVVTFPDGQTVTIAGPEPRLVALT
ncbi:MAG TPA: hypothetical protein VMT46_17525 [Anaerolineaceae bacterium]|nr:hypothetical protein [Anaerolineaceae bacterium]